MERDTGAIRSTTARLHNSSRGPAGDKPRLGACSHGARTVDLAPSPADLDLRHGRSDGAI